MSEEKRYQIAVSLIPGVGDVFAMPGKPKDEKSAGCNALIKTQRAILLEGIDDIIRELN